MALSLYAIPICPHFVGLFTLRIENRLMCQDGAYGMATIFNPS